MKLRVEYHIWRQGLSLVTVKERTPDLSSPALGYHSGLLHIQAEADARRHTGIARITPHVFSYIQDRRHWIVDQALGRVCEQVSASQQPHPPPPQPCFSCGCGGGGGGAKQD